ncbi:hypothetical protein BDC45DRAFT_175913 [Circinella umbellata]|nr:hypothetical protein BDC45DRAFT_175913 [Circinella umbellata]
MMEESRLLYVAMTRAKTFLYCTFTKERESWGKTVATHHSSFLKDMPKELCVKRTPQWDKETLVWVADVLHLDLPENFKKEHKGNKIWAEDGERKWSNQYGGDYNGYGRSTWSKMAKPYTFPAINSTPKPKPTAKSVASQPYATFGSAAAVKREDVITTTNESTKSATAIGHKRKRPAYGANTSHIQKK